MYLNNSFNGADSSANYLQADNNLSKANECRSFLKSDWILMLLALNSMQRIFIMRPEGPIDELVVHQLVIHHLL